MSEAEAFRTLGHRVVDSLADELARTARRQGPVLPAGGPADLLERWPPPRGGADLGALFEAALAQGIHLHHPRYMGHQVAVPLPEAALGELVGTLTNNAMGVFEMGPVGTAMEHRVLAWMASVLGLPSATLGVLTSGGSLGNLTALLAARAALRGPTADGAILVGEQAHYSIGRAARAMGLGTEGVVAVPCDARFRLRLDALPEALAEARHRGRTPFALVGSACSTATGAFDPLVGMADFAAEHGLHFHVDGAHGAAVALSPRYRSRIAGIDRADSVVWDAHKMLRVPSLCTAVLFRDPQVSVGAFEQEASYLFRAENRWDLAQRTFECTKRMMSLPLYAVLAGRGEGALTEFVESRLDLATAFAALVREGPDLELAVEPECSIVCFRPRGLGAAAVDAIRARIVESGAFYVVATTLAVSGAPQRFLRVSLMHPATTIDDLAALLATVRAAAHEETP
ncbi:MAG: aminotransferase class I/II-fold pyridoxal phosphate-dependent enzyme [Myxococcales bacterium]|nr:aminotransferase class I/II-fold pyridoxal phosphate-dependent enzyme [Myxococcales bacterium]